MTTAKPQQRQFTLFHKFSTEVRPSEMVRRDDRTRTMACSFEEITESEEEDAEFPERTLTEGRSPFAVAFGSPFAERRGSPPRSLSSSCARKLAASLLCHGSLDSCLRHREAPAMFGTISPNRQDAGSNFLTLPSIPESASS